MQETALVYFCQARPKYKVGYSSPDLLSSQNFLLKDGNTPLTIAARYGEIDVCKYLCEIQADTNVKNKVSSIFGTLYQVHTFVEYKPEEEHV